MDPEEAIEAGRRILDEVLIAAGFAFLPGASGRGSGGRFARASYVKGDRSLVFSYRWALGCVEYHVGEDSLDHKSYMRLLGVDRESEYSSFSREEPLAGFVALRHDLESYCTDFLVGAGEEFRRMARTL